MQSQKLHYRMLECRLKRVGTFPHSLPISIRHHCFAASPLENSICTPRTCLYVEIVGEEFQGTSGKISPLDWKSSKEFPSPTLVFLNI